MVFSLDELSGPWIEAGRVNASYLRARGAVGNDYMFEGNRVKAFINGKIYGGTVTLLNGDIPQPSIFIKWDSQLMEDGESTIYKIDRDKGYLVMGRTDMSVISILARTNLAPEDFRNITDEFEKNQNVKRWWGALTGSGHRWTDEPFSYEGKAVPYTTSGARGPPHKANGEFAKGAGHHTHNSKGEFTAAGHRIKGAGATGWEKSQVEEEDAIADDTGDEGPRYGSDGRYPHTKSSGARVYEVEILDSDEEIEESGVRKIHESDFNPHVERGSIEKQFND